MSALETSLGKTKAPNTCSSRGCSAELKESHYFPGKKFCSACGSWHGEGKPAVRETKSLEDEITEKKLKNAKKKKKKDPISCGKHPKYGGIRKPRTECSDCWALYHHNNPDKT